MIASLELELLAVTSVAMAKTLAGRLRRL